MYASRSGTARWPWLAPATFVLTLAAAACGGLEDYPAHDNEREPFFRRPYPNGTYVVTTFGGPSDASAYGGKTACGTRVYGNKFYSTGVYGWGCNAKIRVTANGKCAIVRVIDNGPASWVESKAGSRCGVGRVLDVSPAVTKHLFGKSGYGWSDCKKLEVERVSDSLTPGPCSGSSNGGSYTPGTLPGVGTECQIGQAKGTCKDSSSSSCATGFKPGYCPGGNSVQCCLTQQSSGGGAVTGDPAPSDPAPSDPAPAASAGGVGTACQVGSYAGTCKDTSNSSCTSGFHQGYCPGGNSVMCCLDGAQSTEPGVGTSCQVGSQSGTCQDTNLQTCGTGYKTGYCPGGNNVKCCLQ